MDKITDFKGVRKYYCIDCLRFHIKKYNYKILESGKRIKLKNSPFFKHKENAYKLTDTELFNMKFNKSISKYSIKSHKESLGSRKQ